MPLLSPNQIHEVLKNDRADAVKDLSLEQLLERNNLSKEEILASLRSLMILGETDGVKMQATKLAVELQKMIEKDAAPNFSCTIVINDPNGPLAINPILIPRNTNHA